MLTNYDPRVRSKGRIPPSVGRVYTTFVAHRLGKTREETAACYADYARTRNISRLVTCLTTGLSEIPANWSPGYILVHNPDYKVAKISDYIGKKILVTKRRKITWFTYPTRTCRTMRRMGDPRVKACRVQHTKYATEHYLSRYRPKKPQPFDMKPCLHIKIEQWREENVTFVTEHNSAITDDVLPRALNLNACSLFPRSEYEYFGTPEQPRNLAFDYERVDIYREIAEGLPKIAGFTFETEANLFVDLMEIKDTLALFTIASWAGGPLVRLASAFLAYNFAIVPTLADIKAAIELDDKLKASVDKWNRTAGKPMYYHYRKAPKVLKGLENVNDYLVCNTTTKETINATLIIKGQRLEYVSLREKLKIFGFDKPLAAIWEMIPFSFVIDWFTDASGFISQFETSASPARFQVLDACYSQSLKGVATYTSKPGCNFYNYAKEGKVHVEGSIFKRHFLNTDYLNSKEFLRDQGGWRPSNRFGAKQALLSGALFVVLNPAAKR